MASAPSFLALAVLAALFSAQPSFSAVCIETKVPCTMSDALPKVTFRPRYMAEGTNGAFSWSTGCLADNAITPLPKPALDLGNIVREPISETHVWSHHFLTEGKTQRRFFCCAALGKGAVPPSEKGRPQDHTRQIEVSLDVECQRYSAKEFYEKEAADKGPAVHAVVAPKAPEKIAPSDWKAAMSKEISTDRKQRIISEIESQSDLDEEKRSRNPDRIQEAIAAAYPNPAELFVVPVAEQIIIPNSNSHNIIDDDIGPAPIENSNSGQPTKRSKAKKFKGAVANFFGKK